MTTKVDCGDIIAQRTFDLTGFYYADLYGRIVEETPHLVREVAEFFNDPDARQRGRMRAVRPYSGRTGKSTGGWTSERWAPKTS